MFDNTHGKYSGVFSHYHCPYFYDKEEVNVIDQGCHRIIQCGREHVRDCGTTNTLLNIDTITADKTTFRYHNMNCSTPNMWRICSIFQDLACYNRAQ